MTQREAGNKPNNDEHNIYLVPYTSFNIMNVFFNTCKVKRRSGEDLKVDFSTVLYKIYLMAMLIFQEFQKDYMAYFSNIMHSDICSLIYRPD